MADAIKVTPELLRWIEAWSNSQETPRPMAVMKALVARIRELEATLAAATAPTTDAEWASVLVWAYKEVEAGRSAALDHARPQIDAMLAARANGGAP